MCSFCFSVPFCLGTTCDKTHLWHQPCWLEFNLTQYYDAFGLTNTLQRWRLCYMAASHSIASTVAGYCSCLHVSPQPDAPVRWHSSAVVCSYLCPFHELDIHQIICIWLRMDLGYEYVYKKSLTLYLALSPVPVSLLSETVHLFPIGRSVWGSDF